MTILLRKVSTARLFVSARQLRRLLFSCQQRLMRRLLLSSPPPPEFFRSFFCHLFNIMKTKQNFSYLLNDILYSLAAISNVLSPLIPDIVTDMSLFSLAILPS